MLYVCLWNMLLFFSFINQRVWDIKTNICSDICVNEELFFSCQCPTRKTLASDNKTCGGVGLLLEQGWQPLLLFIVSFYTQYVSTMEYNISMVTELSLVVTGNKLSMLLY